MPGKFSAARIAVLIAIAAGVAFPAQALAQGAWLADYRLDLTAAPPSVPADGKTVSRIRADVRTFGGSPAPDGTRVIFTTNLGWLGAREGERSATVTVETRGGAAWVYATSDTPGTARITARIRETRATVIVTFVRPGAPPAKAPTRWKAPRSIRLSGKWVGYCADANMVEARGRSRVVYGALRVDVGDVAVLDISTMRLHVSNVVLHLGDDSLEAEDALLDIPAREILVRRLVDGAVVRRRIDLTSLQPIESDEPIPPGSFAIPEVEGSIWFVAKAVRVFPGEKVVLERATIYSGLQKVMSLPRYWIIAMPGYTGASNSSMLSVNSDGDLAIDVPFFYRVTDTWTGAVKIQRGATIGGVSAREGWSLALQEEYSTAGGAQGSFLVGGLPRSDWGFAWRDSRRIFGSSQIYTDLSLPDHRSTYLHTSLYSARSSYHFNLRADFTKPSGYPSTYGATAEWLTYPRPLAGTRARYSLGTALSLARTYPPAPTDGTAGTSTGREWIFGQELYGALDFPTAGLGGSWTLAPRLENSFSWFSDGRQMNTARAELSLIGHIGRPNSARLVFSSAHDSGDMLRQGWRHEVDFYLSMFSGRWSSYLTASRDLTYGGEYATLSMDYRFSEKWRLGTLLSYYKFEDEDFSDIEVTVGREFFGQEIGLRWSHETGKISLSVIGFSRSF